MSSGQAKIDSLSPAQRGAHPLREILYRARDPRFVADSAVRALRNAYDLVSPSEFSFLYRQVRAYTMCSNARLRALYRAVRYAVSRGVPGDIVECGAARGGSAALMALTARKLGAERKIWLFDTFEGLPAPSANDPDFEIADLFTGTCVGTLAEVQQLFASLGISDGSTAGAANNVQFVEGLFQSTLPSAAIQQIAVLHIDGDWYDSVRVCLETLYDKVAPNGVIQFDDYGYWQGARKAVDGFLAERGIRAQLRRIDYSGRTLIKPANLRE